MLATHFRGGGESGKEEEDRFVPMPMPSRQEGHRFRENKSVSDRGEDERSASVRR